MEVLALMLELMLAFAELFAGLACADTCPQDASANKKQAISNNKTCLMVVTCV
ncbi:MAG: hypothetical protein WBN94_12115 [Methanothrix sp.]